MKKKGVKGGFFKSLQFRLILILIGFLIIPPMIMEGFLVRSYMDRAEQNRTSDILSQAKILADQINSAGYIEDVSLESINSRFELISNVYDGRILVVDSTFHIIKDTFDLDTRKIIISDEVAKAFAGEELTKIDSWNKYLEVVVPIREGEADKDISGVLLISVSMDAANDMVETLDNTGKVVILVIGLVGIGLAIIISYLCSRPFKKLSRSIDDIRAGFTNDEIHSPVYTETEEISEHVNMLNRRMKVLDDSRTEFVSNVSHELKTPLTSMKVLADSLVGQENVPSELYQDFMADIASEIDRENKIITDLLELVKMDRSSNERLHITQININELLETIMKRITPIADVAGVELVMESFRPVIAKVDEIKLGLAFSNLIENAVKYNDKENGWVHVSLNADHRYMYVNVEDNGMGMPEESLEHIFERFYRVDKSHSREIGGTGLGLAITKSVILLHRGEIKVSSNEGEGTLFTVRIPLNYIGKEAT